MSFGSRLRNSLYHNNNLWILLWFLILINALAFIALAGRFSLFLLAIFLLAAIAGAMFIKIFGYAETAKDISRQVDVKVNQLMQEIKPLCEEIFKREVDAAVTPLLEEIYEDFEKNLEWFWEAGQSFAREVDKNINDIRAVLKIVRTSSDERYKLVNKLGENLDVLANITYEMKHIPERNRYELERFMANKADVLKAGLNVEKDIFYDYIYRILVQQIEEYGDKTDITQYFDTYKLGDQFTGILKKSLENRLGIFREEVAGDLANYSADLVGKMQKFTLRTMNILEDVNADLSRLVEGGKNESTLVLKRLRELSTESAELKEKAGEIMLTLAWHDILLERRWQSLKEQLYVLKDNLISSIEKDLLEGMKQIVEQKVPGISYSIQTSRQALWYKNLLEAELFYQVFKEKKYSDIVTDGVYPLLLFIAVVEDLVINSIKIGEEGLRLKRNLKKEARSEEYKIVFQYIKEMVGKENADLETYLADIFPHMFYNFCNNPYVKMVPDNLSIAAWALFLLLITHETGENDIYLLIGFLLIAYKVRNSYIDPLKNEPLPLENDAELENIRYVCYRAAGIISCQRLNGITRMSFMQF